MLKLSEFLKPKKPAAAGISGVKGLTGVDTAILAEAGDLMKKLVLGIDILPNLATGLERFVAPLSSLLGKLESLISKPKS